jgi:two-component system cell cycle sensor histidine kinase/response regulator CckA
MQQQAAHDLGNLFTVIRGYRDWARQDLNHALERLAKAAEAETRALQILLSMQTNTPTADAGVFDINEVTAELVSLLGSGEILGRDVKLSFAPWSAPLNVRGDALTFFRALLNLCMNARNAMADQIILETGLKGIDCWIFLQDNGCGIELGELENLWEGPASAGPHGHGLAIVKAAVHAMGGRTVVASEPGKGTRFTIGIPLVTGTLAA